MQYSSNVTDASNPELSPTSAKLLRLDIDVIEGYARNPRRQGNPEYDRIKASIQVSGLDQPLVVTQRPDEKRYLLQAGGNTRLRALKALYEESGEERFRWVLCLYVAWCQESDVLMAHLRENELRGSLHFIDKARAVFDAKQLFEKEQGASSLTLRELARLCRERGFNLNPGLISKMGYAVQRLLPVIPLALSAGLGRPQVERIRALDRTAGDLWERYGEGDRQEYNDIFLALCQRYDTPDWDLYSLKQAIENELASETEQSLHVVRLTLDAALAGRALPNMQDLPIEQHTDLSDEHNLSELTEVSTTSADRSPNAFPDNSAAPTLSQVLPRTVAAFTPDGSTHADLDALRLEIYALVYQLAENHGIADTIIHLPDNGCGFLVCHFPAQSLEEVLDASLLAQVSMTWWHLFACADMCSAPVSILTRHLNGDPHYLSVLKQRDLEAVAKQVHPVSLDQIGKQYWQHLSNNDWQILIQLIGTYRQLCTAAGRSGLTLWTDKEDK